jgi:hypothetical protein
VCEREGVRERKWERNIKNKAGKKKKGGRRKRCLQSRLEWERAENKREWR